METFMKSLPQFVQDIYKIILRETTCNDFEFSVDKNPPQCLKDKIEEYNEKIKKL